MDGQGINRLLELRIKDVAGKHPSGSPADRRKRLAQCLSLDPLPPSTELCSRITGTLAREGYRIEKVRYESRPGVLVTAHLYLPEGTGAGKSPVILRPYGHWDSGKSSPVVQASAISLALAGYACFVVDSPGHGGDMVPQNERAGMGSHDDVFLAMGSPVQGVYVWDLMRGLDYLATRADVDLDRVGITGEGGGGEAAVYALALDDRIKVVVPVVSMGSFEVNPHLGCLCNHVPGILTQGDYADILGLRAETAAVMILGAEGDPENPPEALKRTDEKLRKLFRGHRAEHRYRFELFQGPRDYNRRMREAALAFFDEHLRGANAAPYVPEARPITDGNANPSPAETVNPRLSDLLVTGEGGRATVTFRDLLTKALDEPYPEPYRPEMRVAPWRRYGNLSDIRPGAILAIHDATVANPNEPNSVGLPADELDLRLCILLGLSGAEVLAQILHFSIPGGAEGWESAGAGLAGDALTSMIASVRTLVSAPEAPPKAVVAEGPIASLVARFLVKYRPSLHAQTSHPWTSWADAVRDNLPAAAQPGARYLEWV